MHHTRAQTPVYLLRMRMAVEHPSLICFLTLFPPGKACPGRAKPCGSGSRGTPRLRNTQQEGCALTVWGRAQPPPLSALPPQNGDGDGKESAYSPANGLFNNPGGALPPAGEPRGKPPALPGLSCPPSREH